MGHCLSYPHPNNSADDAAVSAHHARGSSYHACHIPKPQSASLCIWGYGPTMQCENAPSCLSAELPAPPEASELLVGLGSRLHGNFLGSCAATTDRLAPSDRLFRPCTDALHRGYRTRDQIIHLSRHKLCCPGVCKPQPLSVLVSALAHPSMGSHPGGPHLLRRRRCRLAEGLLGWAPPQRRRLRRRPCTPSSARLLGRPCMVRRIIRQAEWMPVLQALATSVC